VACVDEIGKVINEMGNLIDRRFGTFGDRLRESVMRSLLR
jgi:hypothetical protein